MPTRPPSAYDARTLAQVERELYPTIDEIQREAVRLVPRRYPRLWLADRFHREETHERHR